MVESNKMKLPFTNLNNNNNNNKRHVHHTFSFLFAIHFFLQNRTANFKTSNYLSNRYGAPLFPKNALRKGEKTKLKPEKSLENQNFMLIK